MSLFIGFRTVWSGFMISTAQSWKNIARAGFEVPAGDNDQLLGIYSRFQYYFYTFQNGLILKFHLYKFAKKNPT